MFLSCLGPPPQQVMPGGQPMPPHTGLMRPPMTGPQPLLFNNNNNNQQKGPNHSMDTSHANNLTNGDQHTTRSTNEPEKVVKLFF